MKKFSSFDLAELSVQLIEVFREALGENDEEFLRYMDDNGVWKDFDDESIVTGFMYDDTDDIIRFFGRYLSENEQDKIVSRYNSRFQRG